MSELEKIEEAIRVAQSATKIIEENLREVMETKEKPIPGWMCPKCGSDRTSVTESRAKDDFRYRRKVCLECGQLFSTVEIVMGEQ